MKMSNCSPVMIVLLLFVVSISSLGITIEKSDTEPYRILDIEINGDEATLNKLTGKTVGKVTNELNYKNLNSEEDRILLIQFSDQFREVMSSFIRKKRSSKMIDNILIIGNLKENSFKKIELNGDANAVSIGKIRIEKFLGADKQYIELRFASVYLFNNPDFMLKCNEVIIIDPESKKTIFRKIRDASVESEEKGEKLYTGEIEYVDGSGEMKDISSVNIETGEKERFRYVEEKGMYEYPEADEIEILKKEAEKLLNKEGRYLIKTMDEEGNPISGVTLDIELSDFNFFKGESVKKKQFKAFTDERGEYWVKAKNRVTVIAYKDGYGPNRALSDSPDDQMIMTLPKQPEFVKMTRDISWNKEWKEPVDEMRIGLHIWEYWKIPYHKQVVTEKEKADIWFFIDTHGLPDEEYEKWTVNIECRNGIKLCPVDNSEYNFKEMRIAPLEGYVVNMEYKVGEMKYSNYVKFPDGRYGKIQFGVHGTEKWLLRRGGTERRIRGFYRLQEEVTGSRVIATEFDYM